MVIVRGKRPVSSRIPLTILHAPTPPILMPAPHGDREGETARFEPDPPHDLARVDAADDPPHDLARADAADPHAGSTW
jgi:hypothetical protein